MPGMKGRELVERLAELRSDLKVLYMSAHTEDPAISVTPSMSSLTGIARNCAWRHLKRQVRPEPQFRIRQRQMSGDCSAARHRCWF